MVDKRTSNPPDHDGPPPSYDESQNSAYNPAFLHSVQRDSQLATGYPPSSQTNSRPSVETNLSQHQDQSTTSFQFQSNSGYFANAPPPELPVSPLAMPTPQPFYGQQHSQHQPPFSPTIPFVPAPPHVPHVPHVSYPYPHQFHHAHYSHHHPQHHSHHHHPHHHQPHHHQPHHHQQSTHYQTIVIPQREPGPPFRIFSRTHVTHGTPFDSSQRRFPVAALFFLFGWIFPPLWVIGACCCSNSRHRYEAWWGKANFIMAFVFILASIVYSMIAVTVGDWAVLLRMLFESATE